jgi:Spy/CpxP family protein refolding chaperone
MMRRKYAIGTLGLMVLLAAAIVTKAQDAPPPGPDPDQGQHRMAGGPQGWGGGHEFGGHEGRGPGGWGHEGMRQGFGGGDHLLGMAENPRVRMMLGLTDEQVGRLHKIGVDAEKASIQSRADMELKHIELRELLRSDNPDRDAIMRKLDEINDLRGKMAKQRVGTLLDARAVLTPEQLAKVKEFMEHRGPGGMERGHEMERHGMGHPPMHGGRPGGGQPPKPQAPPAQQ